MTWQPDVVVYHYPCDDGFASAWVCRKLWGEADIIWCPTNYGQPFSFSELANKNVLVCDFSWKDDDLERAFEFAKTIIFLDHHKTAKSTLTNHADIFCYESVEQLRPMLGETITLGARAVFDMDKSGARLTWEFCFPGDPVPNIIAYVEDRDLWRHALPHSRAVSLYLRSFPMDFAVWDEIASTKIEDIIQQGASIERFYDAKIAEIVEASTIVMDKVGDHEKVPVVYTNWPFASDVCHTLLKQYPDAPFAAAVVRSHGATTWSLRSTDERTDVSEVAKKYGGGGHRNAAGFRLPI